MNNQLRQELFRHLADNENLAGLIQGVSLDGLWIWDLTNAGNHWWSPKIWDQLGLQAPRGVDETDYLKEHIIPEDLQKSETLFREYMLGIRDEYDLTIRVRNEQGNLRWIRSRGTLVVDDAGKPFRMIGVNSDITEHKEVENLLRLSFNASQEAIYILEPVWEKEEVIDFKIRDINKKAEKELQMDRETLVNRNICELFPINLENGYFDQYKKAFLEKKIFTQEYTVPKGYPGAGDYFHQIVPFSGGVLIYNRNNSELKKTRKELFKSRKVAEDLDVHLQSVMNSQAVYILKTDMEGNFTYLNDYFLKKFGFTSDILGTNSMDTLFEEDCDVCLKTVRKCFEQPEKAHPVILRRYTAEEELKSGKWEFKALLGPNQELEEILCLGFDITEQVDAFDKANELLAITKDQNTRLRSFAYIVSHNIRSHSSNISGITNLLQSSLAEEDREMFMSMLATSTDLLDQTINHLNEILTVQQTTSQLMEEVDLRVELDKTMSIFAQDLGRLGAQVINDVPQNTRIRVVRAYLDSILLNLVSNAIKYRDPERRLKIHLNSSIFGQGVRLSITDNGLGIDLSRHSEHVFGMYKTFHGNSNARGFGLFLTKSQIEAMGGTIELDSEIGKGSTFKVTFYE